MREWAEMQAYDEWKELTAQYDKLLRLKESVFKEINDWVKDETKRYEEKVAPLMPLIRDIIAEEWENAKCKYGEELRELKPLPKNKWGKPEGE